MSEFRGVTDVEKLAAHQTWLPREVAELLSDRFFDAETCADWFLSRCYPDGPECPRCGGAISGERSVLRWRSLQRLTCPHCQRKIKATTGTLLQDSHFNPRQLFMLLTLLGLGVDPAVVAGVIGITPATVLTWRDKVVALAEVSQ